MSCAIHLQGWRCRALTELHELTVHGIKGEIRAETGREAGNMITGHTRHCSVVDSHRSQSIVPLADRLGTAFVTAWQDPKLDVAIHGAILGYFAWRRFNGRMADQRNLGEGMRQLCIDLTIPRRQRGDHLREEVVGMIGGHVVKLWIRVWWLVSGYLVAFGIVMSWTCCQHE